MRRLKRSLSAVGAFTVTSLATLIPVTGYSQQLEEITVTARKTSENLQEVPLAITALGADDINRLGLQDLTQITQQDTSVQFDEGFTPSDTRITIRGLSPTRGRPNAATLVDGIDVTSEAVSNAGGSLLINPRLIDIERIEIVKGPQSALYGRSAFAGALQYVTKDPADTLSGEVFVEANSEDAQNVRGNLSIPITDELGVLINGAWWDARGIYKNVATDDYVGGGDGLGTSVTVKWEPADNLSFKWRTEYSDDNFDVAPQVNLNPWNKLYDLGVSGDLDRLLGPNNPLNGGSGLIAGDLTASCNGGPLDNYSCFEGQNLRDFFEDPGPDARGRPKDLGQYDGTDAFRFNQYNKQVVSAFTGKFPDGDDLDVTLMPNYSFGRGAENPAFAKDYGGVEKDLFRTSLVTEWAPSDELAITSYTSWLNATVYESLDLGKFFIDEGQPDPNLLDPDILDEIIAAGEDPLKFSPINTALPADGIHDGTNGFVQNSKTETQQFSQEIRGSWDVSDTWNITSGVLWWQEDVEQRSRNSTSIVAGPECYNITGFDAALDPIGPGQNLDPVRDQCAFSALSVAYWAGDTYQGRLEQPDTTERDVRHFSWYGSMDFDITSKLRARLEARFTRENNEVTGLVQNPCLAEGAIQRNQLGGGGANCYDDLNGNGRIDDSEFTPDNFSADQARGAGGQPTGPSAVIVCGQVGRCDRLIRAGALGASPRNADTVAPGTFSFWNYGFRPMPGNVQTIDKTDRFWAPKATLEYFWTDDILTYFSWSRGIKPGGFSLLTAGAFGLDANLDANFDEIDFDSERLDVWEIGAKTTLFNGRLRLNGSAFYQDFKDKQVTVQAVVANTVGTRVDNISGSEIYGVELDATWQATDNLRINGGWTYLDSEYTDYEVFTTSANDIARVQIGNGKGCQRLATAADGGLEGCLASFNGNQLERTPEHALNLQANYTNNLFDTGYEWFSEVQWRFQSSRYVEAFNIVEFPNYNLTDFRAGILADTWDITFFVNNVFDDDTIITGGSNPGIPTGSFGFGFAPPPFPGVNAGPKLPSDTYAQLPNPRIFGARVTLRFGE